MTRENTHLRRYGIQPVPDRHRRRPYPWPTTVGASIEASTWLPTPRPPGLRSEYRHAAFTAQHTTHLRDVLAEACGISGATLMKCNGEDGHVHQLATCPPKVPITAPVSSLKGVSAGWLRQRYKIWTYREHLRSPSYFAAPCGGASLEDIQQYVEQQRTPAANPGQNAGACAARIPVMP